MENQSSTQLLILLHSVENGGYQQIMCGYSQQGEFALLLFDKEENFLLDAIIQDSLNLLAGPNIQVSV